MRRPTFGSAAFEVVRLAARRSLCDLTGVYVAQSGICDRELAVFGFFTLVNCVIVICMSSVLCPSCKMSTNHEPK